MGSEGAVAVLCDLDQEKLPPVGLVIENGETTQLRWAADYAGRRYLKRELDRSFAGTLELLSRSFLVAAIFEPASAATPKPVVEEETK